MISQYRLTQGEVAEIIEAAFTSNSKKVGQVMFDLSQLSALGELSVIVEVEAEPLKVRSTPETDDMTTVINPTFDIINDWRQRRRTKTD